MSYTTASAANCPTCGTLVTCVADAPGIPRVGTCPVCRNVITMAAQAGPTATFGLPGGSHEPTSEVPPPIADQRLPDSDRVQLAPVDFNQITGEELPPSTGGFDPLHVVSDAASSVADAVSNLFHPSKSEQVSDENANPVVDPVPALPMEPKAVPDAKG